MNDSAVQNPNTSFTQLIQRHPALRKLRRWLLVALMGANFLLGALAFVAARGTFFGGELLLGLAWLTLGTFFLIGGDLRRCQSIDLALPISTRRLWLAHVTAVFLVVLVALLLIVLLMLGMHALVLNTDGRSLIALLPTAGLGLLPSALLLLIAWRERRAGSQAVRPGGVRSALQAGGEVLVLLVLILLLARRPGGWLLLLLPATLLLAQSWRSLSPAFALLPRESAADQSAPAVPFETPDGDASPSLLWRTAMRVSAKNLGALLLGWFFLVLIGLVLGGLWPDWARLRIPLLPIVVYMLFALIAKPIAKLATFDAWPLSRQHLQAIIVLPALLLLVLGYGLGQVSDRLRTPMPEAFRVSDVEQGDQLVVPVRLCEIAWDGELPTLTAPWGETQAVWSEALLRGTMPRIWSPYTAPAGSSPEFFAWQLSRAIEAHYGVVLPAAELQARYLSEDADGRLRVRDGGLSVAADYRLRGPRERTPWFPLVVGLPALVTLLFLAVYLNQFRAGRSETRRKATFIGTLVLFILLHLGVFALFIAGITQDYILGGLLAIGVRHAAAVAGLTTPLLWLIIGALGWAAWRLALRAFERAELTMEGGGCDWN